MIIQLKTPKFARFMQLPSVSVFTSDFSELWATVPTSLASYRGNLALHLLHASAGLTPEISFQMPIDYRRAVQFLQYFLQTALGRATHAKHASVPTLESLQVRSYITQKSHKNYKQIRTESALTRMHTGTVRSSPQQRSSSNQEVLTPFILSERHATRINQIRQEFQSIIQDLPSVTNRIKTLPTQASVLRTLQTQNWYNNLVLPRDTESTVLSSKLSKLLQLKTSSYFITQSNTIFPQSNAVQYSRRAEASVAYAFPSTSAAKTLSKPHRTISNLIQFTSNSLVLQAKTQKHSVPDKSERPASSASFILGEKPFFLNPYQSPETTTRTLRNSIHCTSRQAPLQQWRQQIEQRLQQIVRQKELGEKSVQTQFVHQITNNREAREQIRILMNESCLSATMLHSLTERLANNLEKRRSVERYRKGGN